MELKSFLRNSHFELFNKKKKKVGGAEEFFDFYDTVPMYKIYLYLHMNFSSISYACITINDALKSRLADTVYLVSQSFFIHFFCLFVCKSV